jgi:hypothetical protein
VRQHHKELKFNQGRLEISDVITMKQLFVERLIIAIDWLQTLNILLDMHSNNPKFDEILSHYLLLLGRIFVAMEICFDEIREDTKWASK